MLWLGREGHSWAVTEEGPLAARPDQDAGGDGTVRSPMPGTVQAVHVTEGQPVTAGQPLVIVEAMKMEHTVTAPLDGTVAELLVKAGQQVAMDETLGIVSPPADPRNSTPSALSPVSTPKTATQTVFRVRDLAAHQDRGRQDMQEEPHRVPADRQHAPPLPHRVGVGFPQHARKTDADNPAGAGAPPERRVSRMTSPAPAAEAGGGRGGTDGGAGVFHLGLENGLRSCAAARRGSRL